MTERDPHIDLLQIPTVIGDVSFVALFIKMDFVPHLYDTPRLFVYCGRRKSYGYSRVLDLPGIFFRQRLFEGTVKKQLPEIKSAIRPYAFTHHRLP